MRTLVLFETTAYVVENVQREYSSTAYKFSQSNGLSLVISRSRTQPAEMYVRVEIPRNYQTTENIANIERWAKIC